MFIVALWLRLNFTAVPRLPPYDVEPSATPMLIVTGSWSLSSEAWKYEV
jgi:hypothetical protein